jgi:hypothetical protein
VFKNFGISYNFTFGLKEMIRVEFYISTLNTANYTTTDITQIYIANPSLQHFTAKNMLGVYGIEKVVTASKLTSSPYYLYKANDPLSLIPIVSPQQVLQYVTWNELRASGYSASQLKAVGINITIQTDKNNKYISDSDYSVSDLLSLYTWDDLYDAKYTATILKAATVDVGTQKDSAQKLITDYTKWVTITQIKDILASYVWDDLFNAGYTATMLKTADIFIDTQKDKDQKLIAESTKWILNSQVTALLEKYTWDEMYDAKFEPLTLLLASIKIGTQTDCTLKKISSSTKYTPSKLLYGDYGFNELYNADFTGIQLKNDGELLVADMSGGINNGVTSSTFTSPKWPLLGKQGLIIGGYTAANLAIMGYEPIDFAYEQLRYVLGI